MKTSGVHWCTLHNGGIPHIGHRFDGIDHLTRKRDVVSPVEFVIRKRDRHRQKILRVKTRINFPQTVCALDHEASSDQKHERHRHFRRDKTANKALPAAARCSASAFELYGVSGFVEETRSAGTMPVIKAVNEATIKVK